MPYFVYILLCSDGSFYTGYTRDVEERVRQHTNGKGARYTKSHPPRKIVHVEQFDTQSEAMRRERVIKKLSHEKKKLLARSRRKTVKPDKSPAP
jgi:putative endonuclease